jgi:hypothetical protein
LRVNFFIKNRWHNNFIPNSIEKLDRYNRPHVFAIGVELFKCLSRMVEGPDGIINKKKIHTYIYDRYNGVLCRYASDVDSEFY